MQVMSFKFSEVEPRVKQVISDELGTNVAIGTEEVDGGRIFLKVVSPAFNGVTAKKREEALWKALRRVLGPEVQAISLMLTFGTDEI